MSVSKANVLLTTAGQKSYLAKILKSSSRAGLVVAVDSDPLSPIQDYADHFSQVPAVREGSEFLEALLSLCDRYAIHCVLPQNDIELALLASAQDRFAELGARVAGIPESLTRLVGDKFAVSKWLLEHGYHSPRTWLNYPIDCECKGFVEKDRYGQGSQGLSFTDTPAEGILSDGKVVQERVWGDEYNLDVLRDAEGVVVSVSLKRKLLMRNGSTDRALSEDSTELKILGARIANDLQAFGSIDVDMIVSDGKPYVIDINPRIGGGFPFTAEYFPEYVDALLAVCSGAPVGDLGATYRAGVVVCRECTYTRAGSSDQKSAF